MRDVKPICMAPKVRSGKMSFYEEPEQLLKVLRRIYSGIGLQKAKGCLGCILLPIVSFGSFLAFAVILFGSRDPESGFGDVLASLGILDKLTEPSVQKILPFGIFLLFPIVFGLLWIVNKTSGTPIDKHRVGPAIACLEFLAKNQSERKPVKLELDFRSPDNPKFLVEGDSSQSHHRQTWLAVSAQVSNATFELKVSQDCVRGETDEEVEFILEDSESDEDVGSSWPVQNVVETISLILSGPGSAHLSEPVSVEGLVVEDFEASEERMVVVYKTKDSFLKSAMPGLNFTQVRTEMFPPILNALAKR